MYIDQAISCREQGKDFSDDEFAKTCYQFEEKFCELQVPIAYPQKQDAVALSRQLYAKYFQ